MHTLRPNARVLRGGSQRDPAKIMASIEAAIDDGDGPVLSVFCTNEQKGESDVDCVHRLALAADLPHGQVQVSTVAALEAVGLELILDVLEGEPDCHHHVRFPAPVTDSMVAAFVGAFEVPRPNPAKEPDPP